MTSLVDRLGAVFDAAGIAWLPPGHAPADYPVAQIVLGDPAVELRESRVLAHRYDVHLLVLRDDGERRHIELEQLTVAAVTALMSAGIGIDTRLRRAAFTDQARPAFGVTVTAILFGVTIC